MAVVGRVWLSAPDLDLRTGVDPRVDLINLILI